jgi:hypothetical protein
LAVYYLFADTLLMGQVLHYRKHPSIATDSNPDDETVIDTAASPSLDHHSNDESAPLLARSPSSTSTSDSSSRTALSHKQSEHTRWIVRVFFITSLLLWLFLLLGSALFFFWPWSKEKVDLSQWHLVSQSLGWLSAILYCCSRK